MRSVRSATLERGYAIVSVESGAILRNAAQAKPGTIIEARFGARQGFAPRSKEKPRDPWDHDRRRGSTGGSTRALRSLP